MRLSTEEVSALVVGDGATSLLDAESSRRQLKAIFAINKLLARTLGLGELLQRVLEVVTETVDGLHGVALARQVGPQGADISVGVRREREGEFTPCPTLRISRTIVDHVLTTGEAVLTTDATRDERFSDGQSVVELRIRSAVCVPLRSSKEAAGVLLVEAGPGVVFDQATLRLVTCIGDMAGKALESVQLHQEGLRRERLATVGRTLAGTAHYMKNLLTSIQAGAELVDMGLEDEEQDTVRAGWVPVRRSLALLGDLVLNMLDYSKDRTPRRAQIDLPEIVGSALEVVRARCQAGDVTLEQEISADLPALLADPVGLHRALLNLLTNAAEAISDGSVGLVRVSADLDESGEHLLLTVEDNGAGIPEEQLARVCELFFSTKGNRGTGFGLGVTSKVAAEHGGELKLASVFGEGTRATLVLPLSPATAATTPGA